MVSFLASANNQCQPDSNPVLRRLSLGVWGVGSMTQATKKA
jgi:hypothetical protein